MRPNASRRFWKRLYAPPFPINSTSLLQRNCSFSLVLFYIFLRFVSVSCSVALFTWLDSLFFCLVLLIWFFISFFMVIFGYNVIMLLLLLFHILLVLILYICVSCFMNSSCYFIYNILYVYVSLGLSYYSFFFLVLNNQEEKCFLFFFSEYSNRRFVKRRFEILFYNTAHRRFVKRRCAV